MCNDAIEEKHKGHNVRRANREGKSVNRRGQKKERERESRKRRVVKKEFI